MTKLESSSLNEKFVKPENLSVALRQTSEYDDRRRHPIKFKITKCHKLNASIQFPPEVVSKCRPPQRGYWFHLMTRLRVKKKIIFFPQLYRAS
jgi:hypothetical protein